MSYHSSEHSSSAASSSSSSLNSNEDEGINVELLLIYVRKVLKKWWVIATAALVLAAVGFSVARITYVPYYSSQIEFVATNKDITMASSGQTLSDMNAAVSLAENYKYVLTTTELATRVAENCGYKNITADDIKHFVSVESVEDTAIIFLTVTTTDSSIRKRSLRRSPAPCSTRSTRLALQSIRMQTTRRLCIRSSALRQASCFRRCS